MSRTASSRAFWAAMMAAEGALGGKGAAGGKTSSTRRFRGMASGKSDGGLWMCSIRVAKNDLRCACAKSARYLGPVAKYSLVWIPQSRQNARRYSQTNS